MPLYKCKIIDASGKKKTIIKEATDEVLLKSQIRKDKVHILNYKILKEENEKEFFAISDRVKHNEVVTFLRQFAVMLKAGIPISNCLNNLHKQKFTKAFKKILQKVYLDIESGVLLSNALGKYPNVFPRFFVNMVAIGEVSGTLDSVMSNMADYYENDRKIKKKASNAMIYPKLLIGMILVVVIFLCLVVIPQFETTIIQLGGEVPKITQVVMGISKFIQNYFFIIFICFIFVTLLTVLFFRTNKGRFIKDALILHLPIVSIIEKNLITARFSRAFVILLKSGMTMIDILENLKRMLGNHIYIRKFDYVIEEVKRGRRIANSIEAIGLFPPMLTEMINIGEQSGNIEEVLESTGSYFDEQVEMSIAKAVSIIEPIAIIILGIIVALVVLSVVIPMMSMMNAI